LAHHRHPNVPWIHLPRFVRRDDPRPSFWSIYLRLWRGPTLAAAAFAAKPTGVSSAFAELLWEPVLNAPSPSDAPETAAALDPRETTPA
jgi:hypothetical protein